jgi:hypothetical protein
MGKGGLSLIERLGSLRASGWEHGKMISYILPYQAQEAFFRTSERLKMKNLFVWERLENGKMRASTLVPF